MSNRFAATNTKKDNNRRKVIFPCATSNYMENIPEKNEIMLYARISELLLLMGCNINMVGFFYSKEIIITSLRNNVSVRSAYHIVAKDQKRTKSYVDTIVRHFFTALWQKEQVEKINKAIGLKVFCQDDPPSASTLLSILVLRINKEFLFVDGHCVCIADLKCNK